MKKFAALFLAVMMMATSAFAMTAGTYEGTAQGMMGNVTVSVVVNENAIESVTVTAQNETPDIAGAALEQRRSQRSQPRTDFDNRVGGIDLREFERFFDDIAVHEKVLPQPFFG